MHSEPNSTPPLDSADLDSPVLTRLAHRLPAEGPGGAEVVRAERLAQGPMTTAQKSSVRPDLRARASSAGRQWSTAASSSGSTAAIK